MTEDLGKIATYFSKTKYGAYALIGIAGLLATIIVVLLILFVLYPKPFLQLSTVYYSGRYLTEDEEVKSESVYKLGFWTPSSKTREHWFNIKKANPSLTVKDANQWEIDKGDDINSTKFASGFGCVDCPVTGYRRYEVIGKGRGIEKPGFWWEVTIRSDYQLKWFIAEYRRFWGAPDDVYLEVTRSQDGSYHK